MSIQEKQLAQATPTSVTSLYSPGSGITAIIKCIVICNPTSEETIFYIYFDNDGTTYTVETALFYKVPIDGYSTVQIDSFYSMNSASGNIAGQSDNGQCIFTVFGAEIT